MKVSNLCVWDRKLCKRLCVCVCVLVLAPFSESSLLSYICVILWFHLRSVWVCRKKAPFLANVLFLLPTRFDFSSLSSLVSWFPFPPNCPVFIFYFSPLGFFPYLPSFSCSGPYLLCPAQWLLRSAVPCCSYQFERMFDTCRIPGTLTGSVNIFTLQTSSWY